MQQLRQHTLPGIGHNGFRWFEGFSAGFKLPEEQVSQLSTAQQIAPTKSEEELQLPKQSHPSSDFLAAVNPRNRSANEILSQALEAVNGPLAIIGKEFRKEGPIGNKAVDSAVRTVHVAASATQELFRKLVSSSNKVPDESGINRGLGYLREAASDLAKQYAHLKELEEKQGSIFSFLNKRELNQSRSDCYISMTFIEQKLSSLQQALNPSAATTNCQGLEGKTA